MNRSYAIIGQSLPGELAETTAAPWMNDLRIVVQGTTLTPEARAALQRLINAIRARIPSGFLGRLRGRFAARARAEGVPEAQIQRILSVLQGPAPQMVAVGQEPNGSRGWDLVTRGLSLAVKAALRRLWDAIKMRAAPQIVEALQSRFVNVARSEGVSEPQIQSLITFVRVTPSDAAPSDEASSSPTTGQAPSQATCIARGGCPLNRTPGNNPFPGGLTPTPRRGEPLTVLDAASAPGWVKVRYAYSGIMGRWTVDGWLPAGALSFGARQPPAVRSGPPPLVERPAYRTGPRPGIQLF